MSELAPAALSALWLGILTSISPCPLATNIAAISYVGQRVGRSKAVLLSGTLYMAGRVLAYAIIGLIIVSSMLSMPAVSRFLQKDLNRVLGIALILVGMILLDLLPLRWPAALGIHLDPQRVNRWGLTGAGILGFVFALSFCPVSAALFFGSLIPLALKHESGILLPVLYGIGTALPVWALSFALASGVGRAGQIFGRVQAFERGARIVTGIVFLGVGIYYTVLYVFLPLLR
jgi:cytochrome c biogenesis protein CcdA